MNPLKATLAFNGLMFYEANIVLLTAFISN